MRVDRDCQLRRRDMLSIKDLTPQQGFVIGEVACGHEGNPDRLKALIDCVAEMGAPAVKFQIFTLNERAIEGYPEWNIFSGLVLGKDQWRKAVDYSHQKGLYVFSDVFGQESFQLAKTLSVDGYKIHSEDLLNSYFIDRVVAEGKPVLIGVGGAYRNEIYRLLNFLKSRQNLNNVILMTGFQTFPTPVEAHSLTEVEDLVEKYSSYGVKVGFSDHVDGGLPEAQIIPLMAFAKGAAIVEKHVTIDRNLKWIDYQSALNKDEFQKFMSSVRNLTPLLGTIGALNEFEMKYRKMFKKSACVKREYKKGDVILPEDVEYKKDTRQAIPLPSFDLINRKLTESLTRGAVVRSSVLENKVGIVVVVRCTSNRLPNKAILKIHGRETIALLIERMKRCKNANGVFLATSTDPSDDVLVDIAHREGVLFYRGSLDNVALRFYEAARQYQLDHIVRVTGDALLCDEIMVDKIIASHLQQSADVTFMKNMPYGTAKEVFKFQTIETVVNTVEIPGNTEYLEWFLENRRYFNVNYVESGYEFDPDLRITLDYQEDLEFFTKIYDHFYSGKPTFTLSDVLDWLKHNPQVAKINMQKKPKFTSADLNVHLKI